MPRIPAIDFLRSLDTKKLAQMKDGTFTPVKDSPRLDPSLIALASQAHAEHAIAKIWEAEGGPVNTVGMPRDPSGSLFPSSTAAGTAFPIEGGYMMLFRSGSMTVKNDQVVTNTVKVLRVQLVGLECNIRQESKDEIFGVAALVGPASGHITPFSFPGGDGTLDMGPDGERIWTSNADLYSGPVEDVVLVATLVESDSGDVSEASDRIAKKIVEGGSALLSGLSGVPAESVANSSWFNDGLGQVIGFVLSDIIGAGDDPYSAQSLRIPWESLGEWGPPRQPARARPDDGKRIDQWTHTVKVTGVDDGGDLGDYNLFFNIWIEHTSETRTSSG